MTEPTAARRWPLCRSTRPPRRGRPPAHGPRHLRRRRLAAGDAARVLRAQPLRAGRDPADRHVGGAGPARGPLRVHRRRPEPRRPRAVAHDDRASRCRRRRARRWPRARCASSATRSRWSWPRAATSPRMRPSASRSTTSRSRPSSTTPRPSTRKRSSTRSTAPTSSLELTTMPASALDEVFASAAHVASETIYQQAYAPVPMEGRGLVVDYAKATGDLTIYSSTQSPHEVRLFCARLLGMPEERIRVVMRDTGGGFGQKVMVQRDEMCLMLAGPQGRRAGEVGRGPPREPARRRKVPPGTCGREDGVRCRRRDPGRVHRLRPGLRRLSHPVAAVPRRRRRHVLPGTLPRAARRLRGQDDLHEHRRAGGIPRPVAVRVAGPRGAARHRGAPDGHRSRRAAPAQPAAPATSSRTRIPTA